MTMPKRPSVLARSSYVSTGESPNSGAWSIDAEVVIAPVDGPASPSHQHEDLWSSVSPYASQYTLFARAESLQSVLNPSEEALGLSPLFRPIQDDPRGRISAETAPATQVQKFHNSGGIKESLFQNPGAVTDKRGGHDSSNTRSERANGQSRGTTPLLQRAQEKLATLRQKFSRVLQEPPCPQLPPQPSRECQADAKVPPLDLSALHSHQAHNSIQTPFAPPRSSPRQHFGQPGYGLVASAKSTPSVTQRYHTLAPAADNSASAAGVLRKSISLTQT